VAIHLPPESTRRRSIRARIVAVGLPALCLVTIGWFAFAGSDAPTSNRAEGAPAVPEAAAAPAEAGEDDLYRRDVAPLIAKYCSDCHSERQQRAGLSLTKDASSTAIQRNRKVWESVVSMLRDGVMPPADKPQPTDEELARMTGILEETLANIDCTGGIDPGRVTIRRLNRAEYNNTIRDLVGVDFQPAEDFPSDDVGYGFDNIGDVLSLPPLLFEKYLAAAEKITEAAIITGDRQRGEIVKFEPRRMRRNGQGGDYGNGAVNLYSTAELSVRHSFPKSGEYVLRVRAFGQQAGPEPARMSLRLDGKELQTFDVKAEEGDSQTCEHRLQIEQGRKRVAVAFVNDYYNPKHPDPKARDRNLIVEHVEIQGPIEVVPLPESHRRIITRVPREDGSDADSCTREILRRFVTRAYRRPVTGEELERLVELAAGVRSDGESFERGIQLALQAVLVSPHFLFRIETDREPENPAVVHEISEYELATRLSYFLWSSLPDEELFALADRGELRQGETLARQVRRMLADPKSRALVDNFASQWLQFRNLDQFSPDPKQFPDFDEALRQAMRTETEMFFTTILREDRSILEFLDADYTFVNERLARHYGIADVRGDEFQRVNIDANQRGGILAHGSILAITSNPTRTSPVKRGKWVLDNLLGAPPPPPPPGVEELSDESEAALTGTLRQRMEQHRANPGCASCHRQMDPLGFGLENYDPIGAWRTREGKFPIDSSGTLPSGESFNGPRELRAILIGRKTEFTRCLTEKLLTYALGRGLEYYDRCAVDRIVEAVARNDYHMSALIEGIVASDPFQKRRGKRGDE